MNEFLVMLLLLYAGAMSYYSLKQDMLIKELTDDLETCHTLKGFSSRISHTSLSRIEKDVNTLALTKCGAIIDIDIIVDMDKTHIRAYLANTDQDVTDQIESVILNKRSIWTLSKHSP